MARKHKLDKLHARRIVAAELQKATRSLSVRFDDGDIAVVALDALKLPETKPIIKGVGLDEFHHGIVFTFRDGTTHDVAGSFITWLTRPDYAAQFPADETLGPRVGANVARLRKERGVSQVKLAELADMQAPNVSRLEAGKHVPGLDVLLRVANALQVPLSALLAKS